MIRLSDKAIAEIVLAVLEKWLLLNKEIPPTHLARDPDGLWLAFPRYPDKLRDGSYYCSGFVVLTATSEEIRNEPCVIPLNPEEEKE